MQMFFLKNLVGVSVAALVLGVISIATIAEQQDPAFGENIQPGMFGNQPTAENLPMAPVPGMEDPNSGFTPPPVQLYENMIQNEANPPMVANEAPMPANEEPGTAEDTPLERTEERLQALNDVDEATDDLPEPEEVEPMMSEDQEPAEATENEDVTNKGIAEQTQSQTQTLGQAEEAVITSQENTNNQNDEPSPVTEEPEEPAEPIEPSADEDSDLSQPSIEDGATPSASFGRKALAQPKLIMAPQAWDDEQSRPKPTKGDPNDPTDPDSIPDRRGGKRKGAPKAWNPKMIPIIRMGENLQQDSGFTIIKSWDN
jgi:hypothetical protein